MPGAGPHDAVSGLPRHGSDHTRPTPVGRSAWVPRPELSENWLEVGGTGPQQGIQARDPIVSIR